MPLVENKKYRHQKISEKPNFKLTPVAAFIASVAFAASGNTFAADSRSADEIKAEVARLKQQLEKEEQALQEKEGQPAQSASAVAAKPKTDEKAADQPTQLGKVVVRARNRIESVQDVPIAVSVISAQQLEQLPAPNIGDITRRAAGVERQAGNSRTFSLSMRGIGKVGQTEAQDPSVGVVVDGVNYAYNPLASFDFYDVDQVEVARGPQGTLLGKNTNMGVINVTTRKPSFTPDANYAFTFGQNNTIVSQVAGGGPVIDDLLAWRGSLSVNKGDGTYKNKYNTDQTYFNRDRISGRLQLLFTPTENFNARLIGQMQPTGAEYYNSGTVFQETPSKWGNGADNPRTADPAVILQRRWFTQTGYNYYRDYINHPHDVNTDSQQPLITRTHGISGELNWTVNDFTLTSITGYEDYHFWARNDDGTPFQVTINSGGKVDLYKQTSQEFRLSSPVGGFVDYQAGLYYFTNSVDYAHENGWTNGYGADAGAYYATPAQYNTLDVAGLLSDGGASGGRDLLVNSLKGLDKSQAQSVRNDSKAIFAQANWHITDPLTLTTGIRFTRENRENTAESLLVNNGFGASLNPVSVNGVPLGGFSSTTSGALGTGPVSAGGNGVAVNTPEQLAVADSVAQQYFGVANYASLTSAQKAQVGAAKAIRLAQIGTVYNSTEAEAFRKTQPAWVISPSYRVNNDLNVYLSWQHGEKAGISQVITATGQSYLADPEKANSYELGFKSSLFNKTWFLNADIYYMKLKDYQQSVQVVDEVKTAAKNDGTTYFASATGNVPEVISKGLEIDSVYVGIPNLTINFSGAYNRAYYADFPNSAQPQENNNLASTQPFVDLTGKTVAGAAKYKGNIGAEYRIPVFTAKEFHAAFNTAFTSRWNSDALLSDYGWIAGNAVTDLNIGLGRKDKKFDVSLIAKNVFNNTTPQARAWSSTTGLNYTPAYERWVGIQFSGKIQ